MKLTKEMLLERFEYKNGELLYKKSVRCRRKTGEIAGSLSSDGYLRVKINRKDYRVHRIIFFMHYGYFPKIIDHIDGNPMNNKIENLREATQRQNLYNTKLRSDNSSGVKGVSWRKHANMWAVRLWVNGKEKHFGYFKDLELAELVVHEARNKYHKQFANNG